MKRKTVLITGASRGIGAACAVKFAQNNYNVVINCKNSIEQLNILRDNLKKEYNIDCLAVKADVGSYEDVINMFDLINERFGGVDVLINNAGIAHIGLLSDMTIDEWNNVINTNLTSVFNCCKAVIPYMVHNKNGRIINVSSIWGVSGASCEVAYSASKGGINSFTKALAKELAPSGISVNAVAFGVIDTEMNMCFSKEERADLAQEIAIGRFGTTLEAAEFIFDLAGKHIYLTGQIIGFDGGF